MANQYAGKRMTNLPFLFSFFIAEPLKFGHIYYTNACSPQTLFLSPLWAFVSTDSVDIQHLLIKRTPKNAV